MPPPSATLTGPEVDLIRRCLLHIDHQAEDLLLGVQSVQLIVSRLGAAVAGIHYLLDRAQEREGAALGQ